MLRFRQFFPVALLMISIAGCQEEGAESPDAQIDMAAEYAHAEAYVHDFSNLEGESSRSFFSIDVTPTDVFQPAGDLGGGRLNPGDFFPPINGGKSFLVRVGRWVKYYLVTTGLPYGAYTNWFVVVNNPENCEASPCTLNDVFGPNNGPDGTNASVFWISGNVVRKSGIGRFWGSVKEGVINGEPETQHMFGPGLLDASCAEVHLIVKYHGPASKDPEVLHEQLTTLLGSCEQDANAYDAGPGFDLQCFDPQLAIHIGPCL